MVTLAELLTESEKKVLTNIINLDLLVSELTVKQLNEICLLLMNLHNVVFSQSLSRASWTIIFLTKRAIEKKLPIF
jgi:hypothetical protein